MEWNRQVYKWLNFVQHLALPPTCVLCGAPGEIVDLCPRCRDDFALLGPACSACASPLPLDGPELCGACQRKSPPYRATALFRYAPPLDRLIIALKFQQRLQYARLLGELMADLLAQRPRPDLLIPVPLHPSRLHERGYNQALELARPIARRLGIALSPWVCQRTRATPGQSGLDLIERKRNLRGAFEVTKPVNGLRVAIIDDVVTTGTTVGELATVLRKAGALEVEVWALARTVVG